MKKLFLLLLACFLSANLASISLEPVSEETQDSIAKAQFNKLYSQYILAGTKNLYEGFQSVDWNKPKSDSIYALMFACIPHLDGEFAESYGYAIYHFFKNHPEEFAIVNSKLKYLPSDTHQNIMNALYDHLIFCHEEEYQTRDKWRKIFPEIFARCIDLFPERYLYNIENNPFNKHNWGIPVYILDRKDKSANIRNAPNGKVVGTLKNYSTIYIDSIQGKWCRLNHDEISSKSGFIEIAFRNPELWVHQSCISGELIDKLKYFKDRPPMLVTPQQQKRRARIDPAIGFYADYKDPNSCTKIEFSEENNIDFILDKVGYWVKVQLKNGEIGWIHSIDFDAGPFSTKTSTSKKSNQE